MSEDTDAPNKMYHRSGDIKILRAVVGATITAYWYDDPAKYKSSTTAAFKQMLTKKGYVQLN